jgi:hypothetical protein
MFQIYDKYCLIFFAEQRGKKRKMRIFTASALLLPFISVSGFALRSNPNPIRSRVHRQRVSYHQSTSNSETNSNEASCLIFQYNSVVTSEAAPYAPPSKIWDFFQQSQQRNCMISAGNQREVNEVVDPMEDRDQLLSLWKTRCLELGTAELPTSSDCILRVTTGGIQFPGLSLTSEAIIGAKLCKSENDYPVYEFTLIRDSQHVKGFPPTVWIYEKLTGTNRDNTSNLHDPSPARSLSKVTASPLQDGKYISFQVQTDIRIIVAFPSFLLKILPVSKEKAEEQGSISIGKSIEKDLKSAMETLRQQYLDAL